ncbi:MAG: hypothetical protein KBA31_18105 [Alphaproteobacteria bacterium]|nr:hypothetical protein [Alphaproteobacteria bacterium]
MGNSVARLLTALCLLLATSSGATAQAVTDVPLAPKQTGGVYPLALNAENRNCNQLLDFRFSSQASWIKLPPDPVARQIPQGQSRQVQASIDLRGTAPGQLQGIVEVECENCGFFIFASCKVDKQQLRFIVNVLPLAAAGPGGPGAGPPQGGGQGNPAGGAAPPPAAPKVQSNDGFTPPPKRTPPVVDPEGPNVPETIKKKWRRACKAGDDANAKRAKCEEELQKLRDAADAAAKAAKAAQDAYEKLAKETLKEAEAVDALHQIFQDALARAKSALDAYDAAAKALGRIPRKNWFIYPSIDGPGEPCPELRAFGEAEARLKEAADDLKAAQDAHLKAERDLEAKFKSLKAAEKAASDAQKRANEAEAAAKAKADECGRLKKEAERAAKEKEEAEDEAGEHCGTPY